MANKPLHFAPACPIPFVIDPKTRIEQLKPLLLDDRWEFQKVNILKLIQMYEDGEIGSLTSSTTIWLRDGAVMDREPGLEDIPEGSAVWAEGISYQMMQHNLSQAVASQMAQSASYGILAGTRMHEIHARFRLVPDYGGDPNLTINIIIANDTGSDIQTIFASDLQNLNYNGNIYQGRLGLRQIQTPSGSMVRECIMIQLQLVDVNGREITRWFLETAVITADQPGLLRLSGLAIRNHLYFATAPGNTALYVATKKNGIISQLPVV